MAQITFGLFRCSLRTASREPCRRPRIFFSDSYLFTHIVITTNHSPVIWYIFFKNISNFSAVYRSIRPSLTVISCLWITVEDILFYPKIHEATVNSTDFVFLKRVVYYDTNVTSNILYVLMSYKSQSLGCLRI